MCSLAVAALFVTAPTAFAASGSASGPEGQKLTVSKTSGLAAAGETVTVSGTGYNTEKGIYVAFCVDNGPGKTPTPCVGGVDMSGESGASVWVSSNPPSYGEGLAKPYGGSGKQGTFSVQLKVRAKDANTDCTAAGVTCAVITRNDHTRGGDQSQTVRIPVTFGTADSGTTGGSSTAPSTTPSASATASTGGSTGSVTSESSGSMASTGSGLALPLGLASAGLLAAGGGAWVWARRRRATAA
ncbi:neocarzinostatin apoprotein domain-containing protein [Streptomyces sp. NPDC004539]|uniref:neocarzinostatin apoprotein domain-containing protein n=1 Tax=Streptomyces sp. NPDC004539 TaxID=3154280 RepID=UPI0033A74F3B